MKYLSLLLAVLLLLVPCSASADSFSALPREQSECALLFRRERTFEASFGDGEKLYAAENGALHRLDAASLTPIASGVGRMGSRCTALMGGNGILFAVYDGFCYVLDSEKLSLLFIYECDTTSALRACFSDDYVYLSSGKTLVQLDKIGTLCSQFDSEEIIFDIALCGASILLVGENNLYECAAADLCPRSSKELPQGITSAKFLPNKLWFRAPNGSGVAEITLTEDGVAISPSELAAGAYALPTEYAGDIYCTKGNQLGRLTAENEFCEVFAAEGEIRSLSLCGEYIVLSDDAAEYVLCSLGTKLVGDIAAIGEVTVDKAELLASLRARYEALSDAQKNTVNNISELEAAEATLKTLLGEPEEEAPVGVTKKVTIIRSVSYDIDEQIKDVIAEIDALDAQSEENILKVYSDYIALTEEQKIFVGNYSHLSDCLNLLAKANQTDSSFGVTLGGADVLARLCIGEAENTEKLRELAQGGEILLNFHAEVINILSEQSYTQRDAMYLRFSEHSSAEQPLVLAFLAADGSVRYIEPNELGALYAGDGDYALIRSAAPLSPSLPEDPAPSPLPLYFAGALLLCAIVLMWQRRKR